MGYYFLRFILINGILAQAARAQEFFTFAQAASSNGSCRYLPTDAEWPSQDTWAALNSSVGGRLIQTVPIAAVCHDPDYNEEECNDLQESWSTPVPYEASSSAFMMPWLQNKSCDPFTPRAEPCQLGNFVSYSINVSSANDVKAGLQFAEKNNIRLVIKNTGHDYLGKSTGKGGLGLWTHSLNSSTFIENYQSNYYSGPAFRFGAGVLAYEAYIQADAHGYRVVGGECPTVGIAGGYTQGGGHSMLSSLYGLGADQTLEWEVVTPEGEHLVATPTQNSDLYWALSGGGGGTYGVVLSFTVRVYEDGIVGGARLIFSEASVSNDTYWEAIEYFHAGLPSLVEDGRSVVYYILPGSFEIASMTSPGSNQSEVRSQLSYFTSYLDAHQIPYSMNVTSYPKYLDHFIQYFGPLPEGNVAASLLIGSQLVSRSTIEERNSDVTATLKHILNTPPFYAAGVGLNVTGKNTVSDNAVLPAWRQASVHMIIIGPWNYTATTPELVSLENTLTNDLNPALDKLSPGGGAYMNEANFQLASWKEDFFGSNYARLEAIKAKYDPTNLLYATTAMGSDAWTVAEDGRLCRT